VSDADPEVVARINELGDQIARLELEEATLVKDIEARKKAIDDKSAPRFQRIETALRAAKKDLTEYIEANRASLIAPGRQSFTTQLWTFQFKLSKGGKLTIVEGAADAIMKRAGRFGLVKKIAEPPKSRKWKFKLSKFLARMETHPEERAIFDDYVTVTEDAESLRMTPNAGRATFHDGTKLSPDSIVIKSK